MAKKLKQVRSTHTADEAAAIELKAKEYRMAGKSDEEAEKLATEDVRKTDDANEEAFEEFVKQIKLYDVLDDLLRRSTSKFATEYNKTFPEHNLSFNLRMRKLDKENRTAKGVIWRVQLVLEMKKQGVTSVIVAKQVDFRHVKEIRDQAGWKWVLYEALFQQLVNSGLTHLLFRVNDPKDE